MQARVTRTRASVGSLISESGTFSTRTSPALYITVARIPARSFQGICKAAPSAAILFIRNLLHPIDGGTVQFLLNGNVTHGRGGTGAVPVLFARSEPHDIARTDLLDWTAFALNPAKAGCH